VGARGRHTEGIYFDARRKRADWEFDMAFARPR